MWFNASHKKDIINYNNNLIKNFDIENESALFTHVAKIKCVYIEQLMSVFLKHNI